jgi:CBS domain-containing protein
MKVMNLMSETPFCCKETDTVQHAAELMKLHDVGPIPVVNDSEECQLLGIVTDRDICLKVVGAGKAGDSVKVAEVMSKAPTTCHADDSATSCEALMERHQLRRVPVFDDQGRCIGIVSQADIALHDSAKHTSHTVAAISRRHVLSKNQASMRSVAVGMA